MHSLKMTEPAIIAQKVANVAIKTTKLWTWTQSHLETMLGHNGVLLTRFVSTNRKRQFETMWCHQHQTWMGSPVHGHFDGKIVEHVELNEGCPQQNTLYYFMIFQNRFQFFWGKHWKKLAVVEVRNMEQLWKIMGSAQFSLKSIDLRSFGIWMRIAGCDARFPHYGGGSDLAFASNNMSRGFQNGEFIDVYWGSTLYKLGLVDRFVEVHWSSI